jgi:dTDP-4-amino-4,6-dideoxygalactose transaminase
MLRNNGQRIKLEHLVPGGNSRLDTLQAAVLRVKMAHLDRWNTARGQIAAAYDRRLAGADLVLPEVAPYNTHVFHLYVVRTRRRAVLQHTLDGMGVGYGVHYPVPPHLQPALGQLGYQAGSFPVAERIASELLSLPLYPEITEEQIDLVASVCRAC